jgi:hypothetical protein
MRRLETLGPKTATPIAGRRLNVIVLVRRLATALTLSVVALSAAAPPSTAAPGEGTVEVTFAYDTGSPVTVLASFTNAAGKGTSQAQATSTYSASLPADTTYGAVLVGGWGGVTCVRLTPCSWLSIQNDPMAALPTSDAPLLTEGGTAKLVGTVQTPKLSGAGTVGSPLTIIVPPGLTDLANVYATSNHLSVEPGVTWLRNGVQIPGASGLTYTPTAADAGSTISTVVSYPPAITQAWATLFPALVPGPLTTSGIAVPRPLIPPAPTPGTSITPSIRLSLPAKVKQGERPKVYVTAKDGAASVPGIVKLKVGKKRALQATLRAGLATFTLPRLKPGRYVVTATYTGSGEFVSVTTTKKVTIKPAKKPRH